MSVFYNYNGQITESPKADCLSNRAFHFGDGLFESIRIINGKPVLLDRHFKRLSKSLTLINIQSKMDFGIFEEEVNKCILANKVVEGGRLRFTAFRANGGYYTPANNQLEFLLEAEKLPDNFHCLNEQGFSFELYNDFPLHNSAFSRMKSLNALPYVMAALFQKENSLDAVLMMNSYGFISEGGNSNVFLFDGNTLLTPSLDQACVEGVMRSKIIEMANNAGIKTIEGKVKPADLEIAEEVFFTNAIKGIQWAGAFRKKRYFNNVSRLLTNELNRNLAKD